MVSKRQKPWKNKKVLCVSFCFYDLKKNTLLFLEKMQPSKQDARKLQLLTLDAKHEETENEKIRKKLTYIFS